MSNVQQRFNDKLSTKSKNYARNMRSAFTIFLERYDLTAEELYNKQKNIEKGIALGEMEPFEMDWLPDLVQELVLERVNNGLNANYAKDIHKSVSMFCRVNHLRYTQSNHDLPHAENIGKSAFNKAHITKIWDHSEGLFKKRNRAVMAFLKDSGLRPVDLSQITIKDYKNAKENSPEPGYAVFRPIITSKKGVKAYPHLGPDATTAIDDYLNDAKTVNYLGLTDDDPLFMARNMDGKNGELIGFKPMNSVDISRMIKRIIDSAGINNGKRYGAYSFRKFHTGALNSTTMDLKVSPMPLSYIYKLQGRKVKDNLGTYDRPEENGELTREYIRHYGKLSRKEDSAYLKQLQSKQQTEIDDLKLQIKGLVDQNATLQQVFETAINDISEAKNFKLRFPVGRNQHPEDGETE